MAVAAATLLILSIPVLTALSYYLGRTLQKMRDGQETLSPVSRQHFEIMQNGGQLNEAAVEAAKERFLVMLEHGEEEKVEATLRPGPQYVFQVRALAEIGTEAAGEILERQLGRRLSDDQLEQSWYWIDLASSLRTLNRSESLPHLLSRAESALDAPLGHFYAAETICFFGFAGFARDMETPTGQDALRLLHRALEGMRHGVGPHVIAEARLGELLEGLWDDRPAGAAPLLARVFVESLRLLRRTANAHAAFSDDHQPEREAYDWQMARLAALEPALRDYLDETPRLLLEQLPRLQGADRADALRALDALRADTGKVLLPLLQGPTTEHTELAVDVLRWSRDPEIGAWLRTYAGRQVPMQRRSNGRLRAAAPRRPSVTSVPYRAVLRALRGHPAPETEQFLMLASRDWDPTFRAAAYGGFGWCEPYLRREVIACLKAGRRDPSPEVRQAARAALARLGERSSLQWFRQALHGENTHNLYAAVQVIAGEGITLLWPELDRVADADNLDLALHARESLARLSEEMDRAHGW